ncbi:MAG: MotA/TolQ/ExbB proton channel family protein [Myxococcota bacterium]
MASKGKVRSTQAWLAGVTSLLWLGTISVPAFAQGGELKTTDDLLQQVRALTKEESARVQARLAKFRSDRNQQKALLNKAKQRLADLERRSRSLEEEFTANEKKIAELQETLRQRQGDRGEIFGVARQMAGDLRAELKDSIISAQYPGRAEQLGPIAESKDVPTIDQLQTLWLSYQQEMTRAADVVKFSTEVIDGEGNTTQADVTRVGPFNAMADGAFLTYNADEKILVELGRQPGDRYLSAVRSLEAADSGFVQAPVDPSRGSILSLLVETPSFSERLTYGGAIGYIVITLGILAFLFGIFKLMSLTLARVKVQGQLRNSTPSKGNPLGRVLALSQSIKSEDLEAYEAKIDEAVLREGAKLEGGIWVVKVVQVAAPLLGLLGTVTGMINTFQAITLFGTGDPRLMAGGISEALVTTMLGLMVAIPLVLLSSSLVNLAKRITDILDEQAAGMIAERHPGVK